VLFLQEIIKSLKAGGRCGIVLDEGVLFRTNETAFVQTKRKLLDDCDLWCILSLPGGTFSNAGAGVKANLLFFTKGKPTKRIWYYDLSDIKVGKKTPLTLEKFEEFFRLLPKRADGERSWTVDMEARKKKAKAEAEPFRRQARAKEQEAVRLREKIAHLKERVGASKVAEEEAAYGSVSKEARELLARAEAIEDAVYDLKAVNPNAKSDEDTRTPDELLDLIEAKGREVAEALAQLRKARTDSSGAEM
jgi:type I restriction enzyme M protein